MISHLNSMQLWVRIEEYPGYARLFELFWRFGSEFYEWEQYVVEFVKYTTFNVRMRREWWLIYSKLFPLIFISINFKPVNEDKSSIFQFLSSLLGISMQFLGNTRSDTFPGGGWQLVVFGVGEWKQSECSLLLCSRETGWARHSSFRRNQWSVWLKKKNRKMK